MLSRTFTARNWAKPPLGFMPGEAVQRSASTTAGRKLKYLLILDFEATCGDELPDNRFEVIEYPTLLYSLQHNKLVETIPLPKEATFPQPPTFHEYVRPVIHPKLTPFCTQLTGITQKTVDKADSFPDVWARHLEWLDGLGVPKDLNAYAFLTCGNWDITKMLPLQLGLSGFPNNPSSIPAPYQRVINVKHAFRKHYRMKQTKDLLGMLSRLQLRLKGKHHSGIDDCRNIARIVTRMRHDGWEPTV